MSKMNPKSILINQLYGEFDVETKNWTDGVLPKVMREYSEDENENIRKWILFDGPVDPEWVENLNTVLDDNKKLCLTSGEVIKLNNQMNIVFEVENLAYATPATVSRLGIVFLESLIVTNEMIIE